MIAGGWKSCPGFNPCERLYTTSPPIYINGQSIKNVELISDRIDISDLNSGMYIILLERNGQHVFQSKLMVNH